MGWPRLKGVEQLADRSAVRLQLFATNELFSGSSSRTIKCSHRAAMVLVYSTVQQMRQLYAQTLVTEALTSRSAERQLHTSVRQA